MNKNKRGQKKTYARVLFFIFLFVLFICFIVYNKTNIRMDTKEDAVLLFSNSKDVFEKAANTLICEFEGKDDIVIIRNKKEMEGFGISHRISKNLDIISFDREEEKTYISFAFGLEKAGYEYAAIYYSSDGKPKKVGESEFEEKDGKYVIDSSNYYYEVEQIDDNWFFYQCHWYRGL